MGDMGLVEILLHDENFQLTFGAFECEDFYFPIIFSDNPDNKNSQHKYREFLQTKSNFQKVVSIDS